MSKKLKVLSEEEYKRLLNNTEKNNSPTDSSNHFYNESGEKASSVLKAEAIPDDIKIHLYSAVMKNVKKQLEDIIKKPVSVKVFFDENKSSKIPKEAIENVQKYLSSANVSANSTPMSSPEKVLSKADHQILDALPPTVKVKANTLLSYLKQNKKLIKWDNLGRVTFFNSEFVPESNLADLVDYSIRDLSWKNNPAGINKFLSVCKMLNVPSSILSKEVRKDWLGTLDNIPPRENVTNSAFRMDAFKNWHPLSEKDRLGHDKDETELFGTPAYNTTPSRHDTNITFRRGKRP